MESRLKHFVEPDPNDPQEPIELPDDWALNYPLSYLLVCFDLVDVSGWQQLPAAGGILDQDAHLMDDINFLFTLRRYIWQAKQSGHD
jgi:hypothetical protein